MQEFDEILAQLVETFIKENGPHKAAEIAEWLFQNKEVYAVISGGLFKIPESNVEYAIERSPMFARDDTGRWHLRSCD